MIDIQITGQLPFINTDFTPAMEKIAQKMFDDVRAGFDSSGYGRWPVTRDGKPSMLGGSGGMIAESMTKESDATSATITAMNTIHQRGGSYLASDKQRRYLFATHPEWRSRSGATGQGMMLRFPVRTYMTLQPEFFEFAKQELSDTIFRVNETVENIKTTPEWSESR
jgi:phage gpG-like protein